MNGKKGRKDPPMARVQMARVALAAMARYVRDGLAHPDEHVHEEIAMRMYEATKAKMGARNR